MPNRIALQSLSSLQKLSHDPTKQINGDPLGILGDNPFGEMTDAIVFGAVNSLLAMIDDVTGLDLAGMAAPLEALLGTSTGLLSGLVGFLNPGTATAGGGVFGPLLGVIPGLGGGTGTLGGLGGFLNPTSFIGAGAGVFGPLLSGGTLLGGLIPGLDASKITSGTLGAGIIQPVIDAVSIGFGGTSGLGFGGLQSFLSGLSFAGGGVSFDNLLALIPGIGSGLSGSTGLGSVFTDWTGLLGSPTGLGTGTPVLPGIGSIPLLGGLLSGSTFLGSLIPGLDASKIISGVFGTGVIPNLPIGQITNLSTLLSGFGTSTSILTQLLGAIPNLTSGLTGLAGLTSVFTDITGLIGSPTALGSGTPVLPGIGSIPVLGGLLSGSTFLGSLIPGLDASKIVSGLFGASLIPGLDVSKIVSGVFGLGFIPSLPAGQITSGTFGAGLIPGLDASKIISGVFGTGVIPNLPIGQITNLSTLLSGFGTSTSILTQLLGTIPNLTSGLMGLAGLTSVFTDITGLLGAPTALGSGTPVLPAIGSIPVLGGLLSGSTFLGSLIPGLDASKIVSGLFGAGLIPSLPASQITSGTFGLGLIPNLPASILTSGTLLTSLVPGLDASKITSGLFGTGLIPSLPASQITSGTFGLGLIPNLPAGQITSGTFGSGQIPGLDASKIVTGTITEAVTGMNTLRDAFTNGLFGISSGSGYTNTDAQTQAATVAAQAAAAQAAAAAANATLAAQQAQSNAGTGFFKSITPSGANGAALSATDFASTGPTTNDLCIRGSNGYVGIAAGAATNFVGYWAILNGTFTTDNQSVSVTLGDQGSSSSTNTTIYMHCDTAHTIGAYCRINNGNIDIGSYTRAGSVYTYTPFTGGSNSWSGTVNQGDRIEFRNVGTTWSVGINGRPSSISKVDASVTFSAARRSAAVSMDRQHSSGFFGWGAGDYDSFRIAAISMADYVVPTVVGSGFRAYRASTSGLSVGSGSGAVCPNSFFDTVEQITTDITFSLTTGTVTIGKTGWYVFGCGLKLNAALTANTNFIPVLFKGAAVKEYGSGAFTGTATPGAGQAGAWIEYCTAGDTFRVGAVASIATSIPGDAAGSKAYFSCARVGAG